MLTLAQRLEKWTRFSERNTLLAFPEARLRVSAFDNLSTRPGSSSQIRHARDFWAQAWRPDKALMGGKALGTFAGVVGAVIDAAEAVTAPVVVGAYVGAAAIKGAKSALGWEAE
jgi:hypothetical protein